MSDVAIAPEPAAGEAPKKKGRLGLLVGLALAAGLGGGAFYAVSQGMIDPLAFLSHEAHPADAMLADVAFVPLEPVMISLPQGASARHLRFSAQLEVAPEHAAEVAALMPRVLDVLNTYLRAVEVADIERPASLTRLRAQMLRRIQVVAGEGRVRDLLVTEFLLN